MEPSAATDGGILPPRRSASSPGTHSSSWLAALPARAASAVSARSAPPPAASHASMTPRPSAMAIVRESTISTGIPTAAEAIRADVAEPESWAEQCTETMPS